MTNVLPDVVRGTATNVYILALLFSLVRPRYNRRKTLIAMSVIFLLDAGLNTVFYMSGNYTAVVYSSILLFVPVLFAAKFMFKENLMQWCFNVVTTMNVFAVILFLSFRLSRPLPHPEYSNTIIRTILFATVIVCFSRVLRPLYQRALKYWRAYFIAGISILACFFYVLVAEGDVEQALTEKAGILAMLCVVTVGVYGSIFWSLKALSEEYALREENLRMKAGEDLLRLSANAMERRLAVMDEADKTASILRHDQRHFDAALLELLRTEKPADAIQLLERRIATAPIRPKNYCQNPAVNAIVGHYITMAEGMGIRCETALDIPKDPGVDSLELAMALSNLLENAIRGCADLTQEKRFLRCVATCAGQLLVGVENFCGPDVKLDESGLPLNAESVHGTGTKSVLAFVKRCNGDAVYDIKNEVFRVRLLL